MLKPQFNRMQRQPWSAAGVGHLGTESSLVVDAIAANRVTALGQLDAYLVGSTRFQPAFDQRIALEVR